jgi:hypothetical protein
MNSHREGHDDSSGEPVSDISIPRLVGQVYQAAPPIERARMLEHLIRPLGVLSLAVVANGVFSKIRFLSGWPDLRIRPEQAEVVRADDVVALVDYVQQASTEVIDGLAQLVSASPVMTGSAAATLLIAVLVQRARSRRGDASSSAQ